MSSTIEFSNKMAEFFEQRKLAVKAFKEQYNNDHLPELKLMNQATGVEEYNREKYEKDEEYKKQADEKVKEGYILVSFGSNPAIFSAGTFRTCLDGMILCVNAIHGMEERTIKYYVENKPGFVNL